MIFRSQILAGVTLTREAIESYGYVAGTAGWRIERDGNAEFNDLTARGDVTVGTPPHATVTIHSVGDTGLIEISTEDTLVEAEPGAIYAEEDTFLWATDVLRTVVESPTDVLGDKATLRLMKAFPGGDSYAHIEADGVYIETQSAVWGTTFSTDTARPAINVEDSTTTDFGTFIVTGHGLITKYNNDEFTAYTPVVAGDGTATWGTRTGWYVRIGKMIYFCAYVRASGAGSGTSNVTITAPTSIYRGTPQIVSLLAEDLDDGAGTLILADGNALSFTTGTGATFDRLRCSRNDGTNRDRNITGANIAATTYLVVEGWYREV